MNVGWCQSVSDSTTVFVCRPGLRPENTIRDQHAGHLLSLRVIKIAIAMKLLPFLLLSALFFSDTDLSADSCVCVFLCRYQDVKAGRAGESRG